MNKERRERLFDVSNTIEDAISELEDISSEEADAFDNTPVGLQLRREDQFSKDMEQLESISSSLQVINETIVNMAKNKR